MKTFSECFSCFTTVLCLVKTILNYRLFWLHFNFMCLFNALKPVSLFLQLHSHEAMIFQREHCQGDDKLECKQFIFKMEVDKRYKVTVKLLVFRWADGKFGEKKFKLKSKIKKTSDGKEVFCLKFFFFIPIMNLKKN